MKKFTVLYAEDDTQTRVLYIELLSFYFLNIEVACDGKEALDIFNSREVDIVLLDIVMPKLSGLDVAKIIRKKDESIPIIMMTAHSERDLLLDAVTLKLDEYLLKPIDSVEFIKVITTNIDKLEKSSLVLLNNSVSWDSSTQSLYVQDKQVNLTSTEQKLLFILIENINQVIDNDSIYNKVWNEVEEKDLYNTRIRKVVSRINKKIYALATDRTPIIENIYKLGYTIKALK